MLTPQANGAPMPSRSTPQIPQRLSRAEKMDAHAEKKQILVNAQADAPEENIWHEPKDGKPTPAVLDHAEETLRRSFARTKECLRYPDNPPQGLSAIFRRADQNHSGKVDRSEFVKVCTMLALNTSPEIIGGLFNRFDYDRSGLISVDEMGRMLFKIEGDKAAKAMSAVARMREVLALRAGGFETVRAMGSQFRIMDRDKTGQLSKEEFNTALDILFSAYNLRFSPAEKVSLFQHFDYDKSGMVDYNEFTRGIRGKMNDFRKDWVKQAFGLLDTDSSGVVSTAEMGQTYDVSQNPAVKSGKVQPGDALRLFMQHFDANSDGNITFEEFLENYQWVSASIDDDDYFELMMRNAWHITGGEGWCANTSNLRVLVKHMYAPDEVVCVEHDMGLPRDPALKTQEVVKRLKAQGVKDIQKIEFCG
jgi:Ca2+-binding EF-hand superfamily protein